MEKFTKIRNIGKGTMGVCALARSNQNGMYYVIKQITLHGLSRAQRRQSINEAHVLSSLRHPNIIRYVDSFLARQSNHLCIIMEYADGGDLGRRIFGDKADHTVATPALKEEQIVDWLIQLALSLHYMHKRHILHRDVKAQNVFLTNDHVLKLGDFGIARTLNHTLDQAKTFVGTPYYLSPELIRGKPYNSLSDTWALGVLLYEMMARRHPFVAHNMQSLMERILRVQYDPPPATYSLELRQVVTCLLVHDPVKRMSLEGLLEQPLLNQRMQLWLRGDVVPPHYLSVLIRDALLPRSIMNLSSLHRCVAEDRVAGEEKEKEKEEKGAGGFASKTTSLPVRHSSNTAERRSSLCTHSNSSTDVHDDHKDDANSNNSNHTRDRAAMPPFSTRSSVDTDDRTAATAVMESASLRTHVCPHEPAAEDMLSAATQEKESLVNGLTNDSVLNRQRPAGTEARAEEECAHGDEAAGSRHRVTHEPQTNTSHDRSHLSSAKKSHDDMQRLHDETSHTGSPNTLNHSRVSMNDSANHSLTTATSTGSSSSSSQSRSCVEEDVKSLASGAHDTRRVSHDGDDDDAAITASLPAARLGPSSATAPQCERTVVYRRPSSSAAYVITQPRRSCGDMTDTDTHCAMLPPAVTKAESVVVGEDDKQRSSSPVRLPAPTPRRSAYETLNGTESCAKDSHTDTLPPLRSSVPASSSSLSPNSVHDDGGARREHTRKRGLQKKAPDALPAANSASASPPSARRAWSKPFATAPSRVNNHGGKHSDAGVGAPRPSDSTRVRRDASVTGYVHTERARSESHNHAPLPPPPHPAASAAPLPALQKNMVNKDMTQKRRNAKPRKIPDVFIRLTATKLTKPPPTPPPASVPSLSLPPPDTWNAHNPHTHAPGRPVVHGPLPSLVPVQTRRPQPSTRSFVPNAHPMHLDLWRRDEEEEGWAQRGASHRARRWSRMRYNRSVAERREEVFARFSDRPRPSMPPGRQAAFHVMPFHTRLY